MFRIIIHRMCFSYLFCSAKQTSFDMTQIRPQFMPCPISNSGHKRYHQMNRLGDVQGQLQSRWQKWRNNLCRFSASTAAILLGTDLRLSSDKLMLSLSPKPDAAAASPPATGDKLIIRLPVTQGKTYMYTFMHMHNNLHNGNGFFIFWVKFDFKDKDQHTAKGWIYFRGPHWITV